MRSLKVLKRLAKQAVDQERQALMAIGGEIANLEAEIERLRQAISHESAAPLDLMTSGRTLTAYIGASKTRIQDLEMRVQALQQAYALQLERVRAQRVEEKRFERLAERRAEEAAREAAAKEQKALDELVAITKRST